MRFTKIFSPVIIFTMIFVFGSCKNWDNFTTYYNTYYNTQRLIDEIEDEFAFQDEKKRQTPRSLIPQPELYLESQQTTGPPTFMRDLVITQQKKQPVKVKLDSVEIKGSKILGNHSKSKYVEGTLYLMAKSYFYDNAWLNSQIKTSELIDRYPDGDWSPDAHLLMSKNYLIQRKFFEGRLLLSRTVDIAWQKERYDVLSEAFRLEAELALFEDDIDGAYRPYLQAIAQSGDNELRAKWQVELASLLFRVGKFDRAEIEFAKVFRYSPDYLARFESKLYRASSLARLGKYAEAEEILNELDNDGKYEEWKVYVFAERMNLFRLRKDTEGIKSLEIEADSLYASNPALMTPYFEMGMEYFREKDYQSARMYFARSKGTRSPVFESSQRLYFLINEWESKRNRLRSALQLISESKILPDSTAPIAALELFELGRIHEQLGNPDSARKYYEMAVDVCPSSDRQKARFLYSFSQSLKELDPDKSDSLLDVVANYYPLTEYGKESMKYLGYTAEFVIDTVAELFLSGDRLRRTGNYPFAIAQFDKLYNEYPGSSYAPKAIYTIGWIFERNLNEPDSALTYYQLLLRKYPGTEYAADINLSVAYLLALRSGEDLPDSLKPKVVTSPSKGEPTGFSPIETTPAQKDKESLTPGSIIQSPGSLLKSAEEAISQPLNMIKDFKLPDNPLDFFKSKEDKPAKPDTTKTNPVIPE